MKTELKPPTASEPSAGGGIWKVDPVSIQPNVILRGWRVVDVKIEGDPLVTRHLIGYDVEGHQGRVSSPIIIFDPYKGIGVTKSGRAYHLQGHPGRDPDAAYVFQRWMQINKVEEVTDVSDEIYDRYVLHKDSPPLSHVV